MVAVTKASRRLASAPRQVRGRVAPALEDVRGRVAPALEDVRGRVAPALGEVREKLTPNLDVPRVPIRPALHATTRIVPVAQSAVSRGKRRGSRAAVKLHLAKEPRHNHALRNLLLALALGGVGYLVYRAYFRGGSEAWVETGSGTSTTAAPAAAEPVRPAPTAPVASEETVASPEPTTPDEPLTQTEVD